MIKNKNTGNTVSGITVRLIFFPVLVALLSVVVYISLTMLSVAAFSKVQGYTVYLQNKDGQYEVQYTYRYEDGEDTVIDTLPEDKVQKQTIREVSPAGKIAINVISQIITGLMFILIIYYYVWPKGDADANKAEFGKTEGDPYLGLKAGLWASIPYAISFLLIIVEKIAHTRFAFSLFRILHFGFFYLIDLSSGGAKSGANLPIWSFIPLLLITLILPFISFVGYYWGYKHFSLTKRLMYGKNNGKENKR